MPAWIIPVRVASSEQAGPMVHIIFVRFIENLLCIGAGPGVFVSIVPCLHVLCQPQPPEKPEYLRPQAGGRKSSTIFKD